MGSNYHFTILDYLLFVIVFVVSIGIGLFYAKKSKAQNTVDEYLFGGKQIGILPVACSLIATLISGSTMIGQSMEVYAYGFYTVTYVISFPLWGLAMHYLFLPMFWDLKLMSTFKYLEMRFDKSLKQFASGIYVITGIFLVPLTVYVPALAFQEVTGISLYVVCVVTGLLCIWYTAIGGIKAVVWTDVFQCVLIFVSAITIMLVGLKSAGGLQNVWEALYRSGRQPVFNFDPDFEKRGSFWAFFTSTSLMLIYQFGVNQSNIQRFLSVSTFQKAKTALWIQVSLSLFIVLFQGFIGAIIFTNYEYCDPFTAGIVKKLDQVFPYFVEEKASRLTGFNGIFIAGIFAAGLSTTSTILNTLSGTIYVDFLQQRMRNSTERIINRTMKITVAVVGVLGILLVFIIEKLGTIFSITIQCFTLSTVGVFGLFINGMMLPKINSLGAKCGVAISMLSIGIITFGGLDKKPDPFLPLRVDGCGILNRTSSNFDNSTLFQDQEIISDNVDISWIFRINFHYYCVIGVLINVVVGSIVSGLTGGNEVEDQRLLIPFLRRNSQITVPLTN